MNEYIILNKNQCKNCYKCIRNCPVKSIEFTTHQAKVVPDECILCGRCYVHCPQNAKEISSDLEKVKVLLQQKEKVIVSIAPSFIANYDGVDIDVLRELLIELGFYDVEETAIAAEWVKDSYQDYLEQYQPSILITSACHSVNLLIQKYYPDLLEYLVPVKSPMQAHGQDIKTRYQDAAVVFIGPCISKKDEADSYPGFIDAVLTFDELSMMIQEKGMSFNQYKNGDKDDEPFKSRFFPTNGGIIKSLNHYNDDIHYLSIDGVERCMATLDDIRKGNLTHCFIEMSACEGSCVGGPIMEKHHKTPLRDYLRIVDYAGEHNLGRKTSKSLTKYFMPITKKRNEPTIEEISSILKQMGKNNPMDELNCGSCGYNTCREKALAIHQGKADFTMCLPFLKERAESFFHNILDHTPSGIIVLNEQLEIQQFNKMAKRIFNIHHRRDILGEKIFNILNHKDLEDILHKHTQVNHKNVYLAEYKKTVKETIVYDDNYRITMIIIDDISQEIINRKNKVLMSKQTIEVTDQVVEKQMRIVQEIASLLGETAAETKIALTHLKEQILDE